MKFVITFLTLFLINKELSAQSYQIIKVKDARKFLNKEVIIVGKLRSSGNSSYFQHAWYYLGPTNPHKQLLVVVQGENYNNLQGKNYNNGGNWIGDHVGKEVQIRGIVRGGKGIYLDADSLIFN